MQIGAGLFGEDVFGSRAGRVTLVGCCWAQLTLSLTFNHVLVGPNVFSAASAMAPNAQVGSLD